MLTLGILFLSCKDIGKVNITICNVFNKQPLKDTSIIITFTMRKQPQISKIDFIVLFLIIGLLLCKYLNTNTLLVLQKMQQEHEDCTTQLLVQHFREATVNTAHATQLMRSQGAILNNAGILSTQILLEFQVNFVKDRFFFSEDVCQFAKFNFQKFKIFNVLKVEPVSTIHKCLLYQSARLFTIPECKIV